VIHHPFGDQDLDADIGVRCLECANQRRASNESEMLGGEESRKTPETFERWLEAILSTASLSSALRWACSKTSDPTSVSRRLRVERSSRRTPSWSSRSAMRRLTVETGIFKQRAASEKLFASTTLAKMISELRSVKDYPKVGKQIPRLSH
jgi:hypothetical protein